MARTMPAGMEPLSLFRTIATSERAWTKFSAGSLLDKGPLPLRERELVIDRTCARCGCHYEWGIHVRLFGERAGLTPEQLCGTAAPEVDADLWGESEAALLRAVDALIDRKRLTDEEFASLSAHFSPDQILELIQLVAFYHGVSLFCGALDLQPEAGMPTLPSGE